MEKCFPVDLNPETGVTSELIQKIYGVKVESYGKINISVDHSTPLINLLESYQAPEINVNVNFEQKLLDNICQKISDKLGKKSSTSSFIDETNLSLKPDDSACNLDIDFEVMSNSSGIKHYS